MIEFAREVLDLGVFVGVGVVRNVTVRKSRNKIINLMKETIVRIKDRYKLETLKDEPVIKAYRRFFWRIGIDPTKIRPSSEALLRRVLRGKNIPLINNVVDLGNIVSLETLISIGIYDIDNIEGKLLFRLSSEGEVFKPIGSSIEKLRKGIPVLADEKKILYLYPHRDSVDTMVTEKTRNVLVISAGVPGISKERVFNAVSRTCNLLSKHANGNIAYLSILP